MIQTCKESVVRYRKNVSASCQTIVESLETRLLFAFSLLPGNPVVPGTPQSFPGVGGDTTSGGAITALHAFEAAIGGANNGSNAPAANGFRTINWDGVKLDGTDFGGNTFMIDAGHTVGIPVNRFQDRGVQFQEVYAVSSDLGQNGSFTDVNANVAGLFPSFSASNAFAMFNDNTIDLTFVQPGSPATSPVSAGTHGFGAIVRNVQVPNTTSIQYFHGDQSLGKFFVLPGTQGQAEFLGELFNDPIVTRVQLTLGTDVIFNFNGTTFSAGSQVNNPGAGHNLVVTDDFAFAEPSAAGAVQSAISLRTGSTFQGTIGSFHDNNPSSTASEFNAMIDWGDGHQSKGTIVANSQGGFDVAGTNTYLFSGTFRPSVDVHTFGGQSITLTNTVHVGPNIRGIGRKFSARHGKVFNGTIGSFTVADTSIRAKQLSVDVDWGDGTTSSGVIVSLGGGRFVINGKHKYARAGKFTVMMSIHLFDWSSGTAKSTATVG